MLTKKKSLNEGKLLHCDFICIYSKWKELINIPGCNGFMVNITSNKTYYIFILNNLNFSTTIQIVFRIYKLVKIMILIPLDAKF